MVISLWGPGRAPQVICMGEGWGWGGKGGNVWQVNVGLGNCTVQRGGERVCGVCGGGNKCKVRGRGSGPGTVPVLSGTGKGAMGPEGGRRNWGPGTGPCVSP